MKKLVLVLSFLVMAMPVALAHEPRPGPNGGLKVDAGNRYHAELVVRRTPEVVLFLYDANDKPIASTGFRGSAILVVDGKTQRFDLRPVDGSRLVGTAPVAVPAGVKGVVQLVAPDGSTAQAKF